MPATIRVACLVAFAVLIGVTSCSRSREPQKRPNIVLIVMDTTSARHLSLYGHRAPTSPNLERIAADGACFLNAFSTSTWTLPSHASMFTGLPPSSHGATTDNLMLDPSITTLATVLSEAGYRTLGFSNNSWIGPSSGLHRGFDRFVNLIRREREPDYIVHVARRTEQGYVQNRRRMPVEDGTQDAGATETNARIRHALTKETDDTRPLFLFVNYIEPHNPYFPPAELARDFLPASSTFEEALAVPCDPAASDVGRLRLDERQFAMLAGLYDAEIRYLDERVGQIFDLFRELGRLDDTLFIVTSDHGEQVGEHGRLGHEANFSLNLYDELLHVPLVVHAPFLYPRGSRLPHPVQLQDLFATCVSLGAPEFGLDKIPPGARALPRVDDDVDAARNLVSEYHRPLQTLKNDPLFKAMDLSRIDTSIQSLREGEWKLFRSSGGARMLFNVKEDPLETHDLAHGRPDVADRLSQRLDRWLSDAVKVAPTPRPPGESEMNPEVLEDLRRLGYVR